MVNRGRSKGCVTCKQRRVKCDEAKPECGHCRRLGLRCGGYETKSVRRLKFMDENPKFAKKSPDRETKPPANALVRTSCPRSLPDPDTAVAFYLGQYAGKGRESASARGYFEMLIPAFNSQPRDSALPLSVTAIATMVFSLWRHGPRSLTVPRKAYADAVRSVLKALEDDTERRKPETLMATVALQLYESILAVFNLRPATRVHQSGALSLLPYLETDKDSSAGKSVRQFMFHTEVASAIREKIPLPDMSVMAHAQAGNTSAILDNIGAEVALLQAKHAQQEEKGLGPAAAQTVLLARINEAQRIESELLIWEQVVPAHWRPLRLTREEVDWSIPVYRETCERLILAIIIADAQDQLRHDGTEAVSGQSPSSASNAGFCGRTVQELVDGICYSVPFYLGNRVRPMSLPDFSDPFIRYPSDSMPSLDCFDTKAERSEHTSHIIAQGPWSILSPLSRLMTFFADPSGRHITSNLRDGQMEWIKGQFLRVTTLLHISSAQGTDETPGSSPASVPDTDMETLRLAKVVRSGLRFMSGS